MRVLVDTNVVLDVLLEREPFYKEALEIFRLTEESRIESFLCTTTITTLDYLLSQSLSADHARNALKKIVSLFAIAPVNRPVIERALVRSIADFEDAILDEAGQMAGVDFVITRNTRHFSRAVLKVFDPVEFLAQFDDHKP